MIAYEIQLRYVIRDKIQSKTKFSLRQIQSQTKFSQKKILSEENVGKKILRDCILSQTDFLD